MKRKKFLSLIFWCAYSLCTLEYIWLKETVLTKILATYFCILIVGLSFNEWRDE